MIKFSLFLLYIHIYIYPYLSENKTRPNNCSIFPIYLTRSKRKTKTIIIFIFLSFPFAFPFVTNFHINLQERLERHSNRDAGQQRRNNGTGDHDPADYHGRSEGRRVSIAAADLIGASLIYPHVNERN